MPISGPDILLYQKKDKIVTMTINRPEKMNTFPRELHELFNEAFKRFNDDDDAWVAVITGAGDKAFSAGADLKDEKSTAGAGRGIPTPWYTMDIWKPMIAAINGYAIALGWMLAQKCDIRIAAEHAQMGITEAQFNLCATFVTDLVDQINLAHVLEIALWGDRLISAQRAYEMGWVNKVVPKEKLMEEAMSWAERMTHLAPRAVRHYKEIVHRSLHIASPIDREAFAVALQADQATMEDTVEGVKAFREKRKPVFKNK
jgi:enoyl-CoA hydratase